jgi:hypothetical protein
VWNVLVSTPNEAHNAVEDRRDQDKAAKAQAAIERDAEKVLGVLAKVVDGATKNAISGRSGMNGTRVNAAVAWLLTEDRIVETGVLVSNHKTPQPGYKLAESRDEI